MATSSSSSSQAGQSPAERFFKYFQQELTALQEQMARLGDTALVAGERKDATDHCLAGITRLSSEVKDASGTMPSHDLKTYSEAIKALQDKLAETQAEHAPKQKFSFKTRKNESAVSLHEAAGLAAEKRKNMLKHSTSSSNSSAITTPVGVDTPPNGLKISQGQSGSTGQTSYSQDGSKFTPSDANQQPASTTVNSTTLSSRSNAYVVLPTTTARENTTCTLSSLKTCCIDLSLPTTQSATFASLMINSVQSSLLLCGSIGGPAHVTNVQNSTIVISCRQLRMHDCKNVDVYLYCTSRPIIEDCTEIRFAEMPNFYADMLHSANSLSNQAIGTNMWKNVDDFKWLRSEQSPNWMILPTEQLVGEQQWKTITTGKPGLSVDEILDIASIPK